MSEIDYIGADELVFNNDKNLGIYSGGFGVQSIMMKAGMSPIMTINTDKLVGGGKHEKVSDLFNDLVIPNWALSYNNRVGGSKYVDKNKRKSKDDSESEEDDEDDVIEDDLHDKLLGLVKEHDEVVQKAKKKRTRKMKIVKGGTKKHRREKHIK